MTENNSHSIPSTPSPSLLHELARKVEAYLTLIGLPVHFQGNSATEEIPKSPGVRVFYDPSNGESGGVYIKWRTSTELMRGAMLGGPGSEAAKVGGTSTDVMLDALDRILGQTGWVTDRERTGVHESAIKVIRGPGAD